ncbi:hypothetical protein N3K66_006708 [Trichothecium roseum]|uniref:Uncharacterized protein n=1 Tax=Trichothecium roseum TaxID=47278 RepID=A0ACC0UXU6_9HYPO|nr:hypothetical protein N3K66_006708 [Trichothecium roseum]
MNGACIPTAGQSAVENKDANMNDSTQLLRPTRLRAGTSPTRYTRLSDDILSHLTPASAVDTLATATGPLRKCLDGASSAEGDFVMRAAMASRRIWQWLEELSDWSWPNEGGSAGFEPPNGKRKRLSIQVTSPNGQDVAYMGSLRKVDVERYQTRIGEIYAEMEELDVDDIKSHVMSNHIMPLSRPTTPMSDARSMLSTTSAYNRMEDLTAVITAIVVQTLPNLAKLSQLLNLWSIRIAVLYRVPPFLLEIEDSEIALKSGWNTISQAFKPADNGDASPGTTLSRNDFSIMKTIVAKKVSKPGRSLDFMLDRLEGLQDTLPDDWLDRMEAVETNFADWVVTCERKIEEAEWAELARTKRPLQPPPPLEEGRRLPVVDEIPATPSPASSRRSETPSEPGISRKVSGELHLSLDGIMDKGKAASGTEDFSGPTTPDAELDELELPPLRNTPRHGSFDTQLSTMHEVSSDFGESDLPEISISPGVAAAKIHESEYVGPSPPSSPPSPTQRSRRPVALLDDPMYGASVDEESRRPRTPLEGSFSEYFDDSFSMSEMAAPRIRRGSSGDQRLQQQIESIIQNIPAQIKLANEPPTRPNVNLNPPDLKLPRLNKKTSIDRFRRSASGLSSRGVTPSFTLSPVKTTRPKPQRTQQEIKVYHLSRSTGEAPIKLFIRCVGENGERVMVRVGGGWADLSEYLKEYASHHGRRTAATESQNPKVEVREDSQTANRSENLSSPPSTPGSKLDTSPITPLNVRKTRRSVGNSDAPRALPATPLGKMLGDDSVPSSSERFGRSRSNSHLTWVDEDSSFLGLAGPTGKKAELSEENKAWVESVKEKVRLASGELKSLNGDDSNRNKFGELGKVGGTKRLFPRASSRASLGTGADGAGLRAESRASRTEGRASRTEGRGSRTEARASFSRATGNNSRPESRASNSKVAGRASPKAEGGSSRSGGRSSRTESHSFGTDARLLRASVDIDGSP